MFISKPSLTFLAALPGVLAVDFTQWAPPGPGDVRSPCPGLNSLANHGILPRNGKGLTIPILIKALNDGMNVGADFATVIGGAGILSVPNNALATSFDLNNLDEHNFPIEHDASLSRADYYLDNGDNYSFNETIFDTVLAYYNGMENTSIPVAAKAKYNRVQTESKRDPKFTYTPQQFILSYGETALYLSVMGDPITGIAPLDYVKIFFGKPNPTSPQHTPILIFAQKKNVSPTTKAGDLQQRKQLSPL